MYLELSVKVKSLYSTLEFPCITISAEYKLVNNKKMKKKINIFECIANFNI